MTDPERYFVISTHRLRDVGATIHEYDEHFWRNGHSLQMIVFDDSTQANVEKYLPLFEQTKTRSDLFYVGPREKEQFIEYVNSRLRNKRLEPLVKNIFRPSYGGNRNFSLMYSLGGCLWVKCGWCQPHFAPRFVHNARIGNYLQSGVYLRSNLVSQ